MYLAKVYVIFCLQLKMCPLFTMVLLIIVTMSVGVCKYLGVLAFVPLWIAQMIMGLIPCNNHCEFVYLFEVLLALLFWVSTLCFCYVFAWSSSPCL